LGDGVEGVVALEAPKEEKAEISIGKSGEEGGVEGKDEGMKDDAGRGEKDDVRGEGEDGK